MSTPCVIVAQLGPAVHSWSFSSFQLTQLLLTVAFGKLADLYGRKPVMLLGIAIFLVGSVLAGLAWSMPAMIVFRLIQGVGAVAMLPVALTIVADLYPARERGKVQGYLASVWVISAVVGPMVGGLIIRNLSWAWIFWINIPIGLAAAAGFIAYLHENIRHEPRSIDIAGAVLFTIAIAALMIALTSDDMPALLAAGLFCLSSALFVIQERRASDPMVSFALWSRRPIAATNGVAVLSNMALMGLTTFLPMYVQGVLHRSPVVAGLTLTMLLLGWPVAATLASRVFQRFGLRRIMVAGSVLLPAGAIVFVLLTPESSPVTAALGSLVMGFGLGLVSMSSLVLIRRSLLGPARQRHGVYAVRTQPRQHAGATASVQSSTWSRPRKGVGAVTLRSAAATFEHRLTIGSHKAVWRAAAIAAFHVLGDVRDLAHNRASGPAGPRCCHPRRNRDAGRIDRDIAVARHSDRRSVPT